MKTRKKVGLFSSPKLAIIRLARKDRSPQMATAVIHAFEFQDLLGEGVHGQVWRVKDVVSSLPYAVKVGHDQVDAQREYNLYCALKGNNCFSFLPINESLPIPLSDGSTALGLVMPLAQGTLYQYLTAFHEGLYGSYEDLPVFALYLANRLEALQLVGFVHGDLKPENILLWNEELYLCDLGLVTKINQRVAVDSRYTPIFRPPEIIKQGLVHKNSDVWAFGCVLFELFTGECLFDAPSGAAENVLLSHIRKSLGSLDSRFEHHPVFTSLPWVAELISDCVQLCADDRPNFSCIINTIESNFPTPMDL